MNRRRDWAIRPQVDGMENRFLADASSMGVVVGLGPQPEQGGSSPLGGILDDDGDPTIVQFPRNGADGDGLLTGSGDQDLDNPPADEAPPTDPYALLATLPGYGPTQITAIDPYA